MKRDWNEQFESQLREVIDDKTIRTLSICHNYSVNFLREWKDEINFEQLFLDWYNDEVINPNLRLIEFNPTPFQDFLKAHYPHLKEFWKDLL